MPTLFIRVLAPAHQDDEGLGLPNEWLIAEDDGSVRAKGVTDARGLSELVDPGTDWVTNAQNIVIVLPGEHVLGVSCEVPGRSAGQIRRALPFVVEEFVAADIEGMHLAAGNVRRGEPVRCNLIDRALLDGWLDGFAQLGLHPGAMISEAEMLPCEPEQVSVLFDGDEALVKTVDQAATVDRPNLLLALGSVTANEVLLLNGELTDLELGQLDGDMSVRQAVGDAGATTLEYVAGRWREHPDTINLLQGEYAPKQAANESWLRWRSVAGIAAIWLLVAFVGMIAQGFWANFQADTLQEESEALYRDIFPTERRITNVRRQMRAKLGARAANPGSLGFTGYLGELSEVLDRNVVISSLNYTQARGELAADLLLRGYQELDRLKASLDQRGVSVVITSAEQQESGVRARIRLGG